MGEDEPRSGRSARRMQSIIRTLPSGAREDEGHPDEKRRVTPFFCVIYIQ